MKLKASYNTIAKDIVKLYLCQEPQKEVIAFILLQTNNYTTDSLLALYFQHLID